MAARMQTPTSTAETRSIPGRAWADIAVLLILTVLGVIGFHPSFGGYSFLAAGLGGLVVGAGAGIIAARYRLSAVATALVAVVAYFLFGSAFAVPSEALLWVLPSLQSLASLAIGAVHGWADLVTLQTPIGAPAYIAVVPYVATWLVGLVSTTLAARWLTERPRTAWRLAVALLGPIAVYLAGILTGTDDPYLAGIRGVTFAVLALVWVGWRRRSEESLVLSAQPELRRRKLVGTAVLVASAVIVGGGAAVALAPANDDRFVLRDEIEPPFDPLDYPSPLAGFREYTKDLSEEVLFTAEGLQPGDRIRLATMDSFTGKLWNVTGADVAAHGSGSFALVGRQLPEQRFLTSERTSDVGITIGAYEDVWIPGVGYPTELEFLGGDASAESDNLRYNNATGTAVLTSGLEQGDTYRLHSDVQRVFSADELAEVAPASVELPPVEFTPDTVAAKAAEFAGTAETPAAQIEAIRTQLVSTGFLSHGLASDAVPSRAGHGADRVEELFTRNQMIGDEEQYASAFALMVRSLGYPARVVMGFAPNVAADAQSIDVVGSDVTAWVEVAFDEVGWVALDPTPEETDIPQDQTPKPKTEPQPQVRQPPRAEKDEQELLTAVEIDDPKEENDLPWRLPGWVVPVALGVGIPLALILLPMAAVALIRAARTRRRRNAAAADRAVAFAWDELLDRYGELGYDVPSKATRVTTAHGLAAQVPDERVATLPELAARTDEAVFSGRTIDRDQSEQVWTEAMAAVQVASAALGRVRRFVSRYRIARRRRAHTTSKRATRGDRR